MRSWPLLPVLGLFACSEQATPVTPATDPLACRPPPLLSPAEPVTTSLSTIGISVSIPSASLEEAVEQWLPRTVAEGRNVPAGVAGRATFNVTRGAPELRTTDAGLSAAVQLRGNIQLCKPLGPVCVEYGKCRPEWTARLTVASPWTLSTEPTIDASVDITRGCILSPVNVDATAELRRVTDDEVAKLHKQLRREVRAQHRTLLKRLRSEGTTLQLEGGDCVELEPSAAELSLGERNGTFAAAIRLQGTLSEGCHTTNDATHKADALGRVSVATRSEVDPETRLHLDHRIPIASLAAQWQPNVGASRMHVASTHGHVLVQVSPWRDCNIGWALLRPAFDGRQLRFTVEHSSDPALVAALVPLGLSAPVSSVAHQVEDALSRELAATLSGTLGRARIKLKPALVRSYDVRVEAEALVLMTVLQGTLLGELALDR